LEEEISSEELRSVRIIGVLRHSSPTLRVGSADREPAQRRMQGERSAADGPHARGAATQRKTPDRQAPDAEETKRQTANCDATHRNPAGREQDTKRDVADRHPRASDSAPV
jgi:hypothetical protein